MKPKLPKGESGTTTNEKDLIIEDLAILVRRLCRRIDTLEIEVPNCNFTGLQKQARDYLRRKGLTGSPLR